VTGATGFIGRNLAEFFAADDTYDVWATHHRRAPFPHERIRWIQADLCNPADVKTALSGVDILIQAAATTSGAKDIVTRPYIHVTDNAVMNSLLFREAFEQAIGQVVFFSCSVMYASQDAPVKETDFDANAELYSSYFPAGWTKVYLEKMCEFYARLGRNRYTVLRHSNIYGPHDKFDLERSHVLGATVTKVMTATDKLVIWGDGNARRDLLYIDDLVHFVAAALTRQATAFGLYNVGSGQAVSVNELVQQIIAMSGKTLRVEHDTTKPSIDTRLCLDCTKAREHLSWEPRVTLEEGLEKTLAWYRAQVA
jgi:GDP-L-fucose synthase